MFEGLTLWIRRLLTKCKHCCLVPGSGNQERDMASWSLLSLSVYLFFIISSNVSAGERLALNGHRTGQGRTWLIARHGEGMRSNRHRTRKPWLVVRRRSWRGDVGVERVHDANVAMANREVMGWRWCTGLLKSLAPNARRLEKERTLLEREARSARKNKTVVPHEDN